MASVEVVRAAGERLTAAYRAQFEAQNALRRAVEDALSAGVSPVELCRVLGMGRLDLRRCLREWARHRRDDLAARVTLDLPGAAGFLPANPAPAGAVVLPAGARVQVVARDRHLRTLRSIVDRHGAETVLAATLHAVTEVRARSSAEVVEVRIDGQRVGVLSPAQSRNYRDLVATIEEAGRVPVVRALVRGSKSQPEVSLQAARPADIEPEWLASCGLGG